MNNGGNNNNKGSTSSNKGRHPPPPPPIQTAGGITDEQQTPSSGRAKRTNTSSSTTTTTATTSIPIKQGKKSSSPQQRQESSAWAKASPRNLIGEGSHSSTTTTTASSSSNRQQQQQPQQRKLPPPPAHLFIRNKKMPPKKNNEEKEEESSSSATTTTNMMRAALESPTKANTKKQPGSSRSSGPQKSVQKNKNLLEATTTATTTTASGKNQEVKKISSKNGVSSPSTTTTASRPEIRNSNNDDDKRKSCCKSKKSVIDNATTKNNTCCSVCGDDCICGDVCNCSEELCQCEAYKVLHSLGGGGGGNNNNVIINNNSAASHQQQPQQTLLCDSLSRNNETNSDDPLLVMAPPSPPGSSPASHNPGKPPGSSPAAHSAGNAPQQQQHSAEFLISGMTCSMCSQAIERAVRTSINHIQSVEISLTTDTARIVWDGDDITADSIRDTIEDIGYEVQDVKMIHLTTNPEEPNNNDDDTVEERWQRYRQRQQDKVRDKRRAFLWSLIGTLPVLCITMILPNIFPNLFHHKVITILHHPIELEAFILWILATPVQFICGWEFYKMAWYGYKHGSAGMDVLVALGTTASYGYAMMYGVLSPDNDDKHHAAHFFETSAVLISFVLLGKWMQASAVRRTSEALTQLMELQSPTAVKITPLLPQQQQDTETTQQHKKFNPLTDPYKEETVDTHDIVVGDLVKVIRGASVPADGRVVFGEISVDESMVTGESVPVLKTPGSVVLGGTVCVESGISFSLEESNDDSEQQQQQQQEQRVGAAFVQVTGVGSSTALAQIVTLVQQAQTRAVPIQSFADQVSAVFVPTVCFVSVLTYMVWYALCSTNVVPVSWYKDELGEDAATFSLMFAIACLVISCPCALGLATPTAVMVGAGVGAQCGVLMKGGEALEIASKVDSVVFDKTGTLTRGSPVVSDFIRLGKKEDDEEEEKDTIQDYLLWLLGSLERTSEHPLARAIVKYVEDTLAEAMEDNPFVQPTNFRGITGRGASGVLLGKISVAVGNRSFAEVLDLRVPVRADELMKQLEKDGKTAILAAVDGEVVAVLGIADELKPDAASSISYLRDNMSVDVWMVTGDNTRTAAAVGTKLGISPNRIISEALPAAKLEKVCALQAQGRVVLMVGDGVNDSPALAQADVGMSLGTGAEIATEASDMVLVRGHVTDVCTALHLSRTIFGRIKLNLLLSLIYNCLGIPIAAGVFYPVTHTRLPPTVAALAMALSSVSVVLSSLTLRLYRPPTVNSRSRHTTRWARTMAERQTRDENDDEAMRVNLLSNDHLASSEMTERIDNRTTNRLEQG